MVCGHYLAVCPHDAIQKVREREIYAGLTPGFPGLKFRKTIPGRLAEVRYLD